MGSFKVFPEVEVKNGAPCQRVLPAVSSSGPAFFKRGAICSGIRSGFCVGRSGLVVEEGVP